MQEFAVQPLCLEEVVHALLFPFCDRSEVVKISPRMSQKRLRFGDDVDKREFIKFAKKYHQQLKEEECASVGRITVRAMSPPRLADIGVLLQEAEDATRD